MSAVRKCVLRSSPDSTLCIFTKTQDPVLPSESESATLLFKLLIPSCPKVVTCIALPSESELATLLFKFLIRQHPRSPLHLCLINPALVPAYEQDIPKTNSYQKNRKKLKHAKENRRNVQDKTKRFKQISTKHKSRYVEKHGCIVQKVVYPLKIGGTHTD